MQPDKVLFEYLKDLVGESGDEHSREPAVGDTHCAESACAISDCGNELRTASTVDRPLRDAADLSTGECTANRLGGERHSIASAVPPGIAGWAAEPFQVLMFRLRGVALGVPLRDLDSIARWNGRSTSIPGQPRWQIGLFLHNRKKVSLVDLAGLIMPERNATGATAVTGYLLLVGSVRWGLICDSIQRPKLVRAGNVRWNRNRQYRPWSHGIMIDSLSVLLNVSALVKGFGTNDA